MESNTVCRNCGNTLGSHSSGSRPWPPNTCPRTEGGMDFAEGPGTVFEAAAGLRYRKGKNLGELRHTRYENNKYIWKSCLALLGSDGTRLYSKHWPPGHTIKAHNELTDAGWERIGGL